MKVDSLKFSVLVLFVLMISLSFATPSMAVDSSLGKYVPSEDRDYWPTEEWQTADPLDHGFDTSYLDAMMEDIDRTPHNIHSVLIIKDGYLVWEEYPENTYNPTRKHMLQSCTKSFTSTLIGIALHEGFIDNVSQRMIDFFPGRTIENLDSRKESITLYHMLTMSEGMYWTELDYPYTDDRNTLKQMWDTTDPIQHILDQPMVRDPGEEWHYNSGMSVLLGAVLEYATGQDVESFAEEYLFGPLEIEDYTWWSMPLSNVLHTDGGLYLNSRDMARLGYLMLNNGTWNGTEIVSSDWVYNATHSDVRVSTQVTYGYQWWIFPDFGFYAATGHYEQKIYVAQEEDLVVVFTANIADEDPHPTDLFMISYILPALQTSTVDIDDLRKMTVNLSVAGLVVAPVLVAIIYQRNKLKSLE
ncbi:MAG: serine hydrolase domain-containing protein [Candidatus Thorarchaeota archaeon]